MNKSSRGFFRCFICYIGLDYSLIVNTMIFKYFRILKENHLNHLSVDAFKNLPLLTTLDLTSNSFTEIPYAITELDTLEKL